MLKHLLLLYCLLLINPHRLIAQQEENAQAVDQGTRYLDFRIHSLDKYNHRLQQQQQRLLKKLKKKEKHLSNKLKRTDSLGYTRLQQQRLSYDSIGELAHADSTTIARTHSWRKNRTIDSLKGIASFVQSKATQTGGTLPVNSSLPDYNTALANEQAKLNYHEYINRLITEHTNSLKQITSHSNIAGMTGIEKQVFYGKARMNVYKQIEEDPTVIEDKALEYLEGTPGFDHSMDQATMGGPGSLQSLAASGKTLTSADLQRMGYQTKNMLQNSLQQKFGKNLTGVTQQMSSQISQWQDKTKGISQDLQEAKQTKSSLKQLRHINKPAFKINRERGLPFWRRIEKQYNWQTTQATPEGNPATLEGSAMAGFKQSPKLTYGIGIAASMGLGQSWSNIHLSLQGLGFRSYISWQWQYGIGFYGGYERMYKQAVFTNNSSTQPATTDLTATPHNTHDYSESVLIGLTKKYNLNTKYNGQIQLLYDVWWQQKGLRSPVVLRFATLSK